MSTGISIALLEVIKFREEQEADKRETVINNAANGNENTCRRQRGKTNLNRRVFPTKETT